MNGVVLCIFAVGSVRAGNGYQQQIAEQLLIIAFGLLHLPMASGAGSLVKETPGFGNGYSR